MFLLTNLISKIRREVQRKYIKLNSILLKGNILMIKGGRVENVK